MQFPCAAAHVRWIANHPNMAKKEESSPEEKGCIKEEEEVICFNKNPERGSCLILNRTTKKTLTSIGPGLLCSPSPAAAEATGHAESAIS